MILSVTLNPAVDHVLFLDRMNLHDTNRVRRTERDAGGKGVNMSRVVAELGGRSVATGFLGGATGGYIRYVLDKQGVEHDFVETAEETRTNFSVEEDDVEAPPTTFNEPGPMISEAEYAELLERCRRIAPNAKWAAMGGSLPQGVPIDAYYTIGRIFEDAGCLVVLDADDEAQIEGMKARPHFIKPNENEAARLLGRPVETTEQAIEAARDLLEMLPDDPHRLVVVSRGAKGAVMACADGIFNGKSPEIEPRSTIGSGDSMIGGMLWALGEGKSIPEALHWGLAAGAATATTDGSEIARRPVVELLYRHASVERVS
jgi:1-phosphofructokinase